MKSYIILGLIILCLILGFGTYYFFTLSRDQDQTALRENAEQEIKLRDANTRIGLRDSAVARLQSEMDSAATAGRKRDSLYAVKITTLSNKIRSINLSKSGQKELDSLIIKLYGQ